MPGEVRKLPTMPGAERAPVPASAIGRRRAAAARTNGVGYADRRSMIVAAAAELFKQNGYARTTLADVAEAVGSDRASLYYYFGNKKELLDAIVTDTVIANVEAAERVRATDAPSPEKLRTVIVDMMVSFATNYPVLYIYLQANLSHVTGRRAQWAQEMRSFNHRWEAAIEGIVQDGIAEGTIRPLADPRIIANGVIGVIGWTSRWYNPGQEVDAVSLGGAYADMVLGGLEIPAKPVRRTRAPS